MKKIALSLCVFTAVACGRAPEEDALESIEVASHQEALTADQISACRSAYQRAVETGDRSLVRMVITRCLALDDNDTRPTPEGCRRAYNRAVAIGDRELVNMVLRRCQ